MLGIRTCSITLTLFLLDGCVNSNQFVENGYRYSVPAQFYSVKRKLSQAETSQVERVELQQTLDFVKENNHTLIDVLMLDGESGRGATVTIIFEPIAEYDPSTFTNDVFRSMSALSDLEESVVRPKISLVDPEDPFGFYRMDISDAYGVPGLFACFLFRATDGGQIQVTIITDEDPHAAHFRQILRYIEFAGR